MKKNGIKTLYRLFSFLSDCTNGFKPFVKYKLILGSLLIGLTATSCKPKQTPEKATINEKEPEEEILCYKPKVSCENDTVQKVQEDRPKQTQKTAVIEESMLDDLVKCYDVVISINEVEVAKVEEPEEEQILCYVVVETQPEFPGGEKELMKYIKDNLKYPVISQENGVEGRVVVRFVVNKQGEATDVEILKGLDSACDKEAIRVIESMPQWIPGERGGRAVDVYYTLPVMFKLQ